MYQSGEDFLFSVCFQRGKEFCIVLYVSRLQIVFQRWRWPGLPVGPEIPRGATFSPSRYSLFACILGVHGDNSEARPELY